MTLNHQQRTEVLAYAMDASSQNAVRRAVSCLETRLFGPSSAGYTDRVTRHNLAFREHSGACLRDQAKLDAELTPEAYARISRQLHLIADELLTIGLPELWGSEVSRYRSAIEAYVSGASL